MKKIEIHHFKKTSFLSPTRCDNLAEAAAVCLHISQKEHKNTEILTVEGDLRAQFELEWQEVTQQILDSRADLLETTEDAAVCIAIMVVEELTPYQIVKQAPRGTGVDFFMTEKDNNDQITYKARLEVTGILKGTKKSIQDRINKKIKQCKKSDFMEIPAYIVVVEFSQLIVKILKK